MTYLERRAAGYLTEDKPKTTHIYPPTLPSAQHQTHQSTQPPRNLMTQHLDKSISEAEAREIEMLEREPISTSKQ